MNEVSIPIVITLQLDDTYVTLRIHFLRKDDQPYSSRTALELAVFLNDDVEFAYLFERYIEQFLGGLIY